MRKSSPTVTDVPPPAVVPPDYASCAEPTGEVVPVLLISQIFFAIRFQLAWFWLGRHENIE